MPIDENHAITMLQAALLRELGDEVDLIFRYGSFLKQATHRYSDLDISYVPAHESTWHSITVIVDEVMIDFYPIHWPALERMAEFEDVSCTVLLQNEVLYERDAAAGARFRALAERLRALQQPDARPAMLAKAQAIFQRAGYQYYLLAEGAAAGNDLACLFHARAILRSVLHCLMVCNQAPIDTRKLEQVLALPRLPLDFAATVDRLARATAAADLLSAAETLLHTTRRLLLAEQQAAPRSSAGFAEVFDAAYPELKGDLQHLMLACERRDRFNMNLPSLYHELMIHMARALSGVSYGDFNSLADYEQDLVALGFPDLHAYLVAGDLDGLRAQGPAFDDRLQQYLTARGAALNAFASLDELQAYLEGEGRDSG